MTDLNDKINRMEEELSKMKQELAATSKLSREHLDSGSSEVETSSGPEQYNKDQNEISFKSVIMMLIIVISFAVCLSAIGIGSSKVKLDGANIYLSPHNSSVVAHQSNSGDLLNIIETIVHTESTEGNPKEWYRVAMPDEAVFYVASDYVDHESQLVTSTRLNVRLGPSETYTVVARLNNGEKVEIIAEDEGWISIKSPNNFFGFIEKKLVKKGLLDRQQSINAETSDSKQTKSSPASSASIKEKPSYLPILGGIVSYKDSWYTADKIYAACEVESDSFLGTTDIRSPVNRYSSGYDDDFWFLRAKTDGDHISYIQVYIMFTYELDTVRTIKEEFYDADEAIDIEKNKLNIVDIDRDYGRHSETVGVTLDEDYVRDRLELGLQFRIYSTKVKGRYREFKIGDEVLKGFMRKVDNTINKR